MDHNLSLQLAGLRSEPIVGSKRRHFIYPFQGGLKLRATLELDKSRTQLATIVEMHPSNCRGGNKPELLHEKAVGSVRCRKKNYPSGSWVQYFRGATIDKDFLRGGGQPQSPWKFSFSTLATLNETNIRGASPSFHAGGLSSFSLPPYLYPSGQLRLRSLYKIGNEGSSLLLLSCYIDRQASTLLSRLVMEGRGGRG